MAGTYTTLRFTVTGAQYDAAFDLLTGTTLTYVDLSQPQAQQTGFAKHVHVAVSAWMNDATQHWRECSCGERLQTADHADNNANCKCDTCNRVIGGAHNWDSGVISRPATHFVPGEKTFTCGNCGETKTENVAKLTAHAYGAWQKHDDAQHKRVCGCMAEEYEAHHWDAGVVTKAPTHLEFGSKSHVCTDCGETKTERVAKTIAHTFGEWVTVRLPAPGVEGMRERACPCGERMEQSIPPLESVADTEPNGNADSGSAEQETSEIGVVLAVAAVPVLGGGGICLYWFLTRKKRLR